MRHTVNENRVRETAEKMSLTSASSVTRRRRARVSIAVARCAPRALAAKSRVDGPRSQGASLRLPAPYSAYR